MVFSPSAAAKCRPRPNSLAFVAFSPAAFLLQGVRVCGLFPLPGSILAAKSSAVATDLKVLVGDLHLSVSAYYAFDFDLLQPTIVNVQGNEEPWFISVAVVRISEKHFPHHAGYLVGLNHIF